MESHIICSGVPTTATTSAVQRGTSRGQVTVARTERGGRLGRSATMRRAASTESSLWNRMYSSPEASFFGMGANPKMEVPSGQAWRFTGIMSARPRRAAMSAWQKRSRSSGKGTSGRGSPARMSETATGCQRSPSTSRRTAAHSR